MPHILVKLWPGRTDEMKHSFAQKVAELAVEELNGNIDHMSVAFEEVDEAHWPEEVYKKDIKGNPNVYLEPKYTCD